MHQIHISEVKQIESFILSLLFRFYLFIFSLKRLFIVSYFFLIISIFFF